MTEQSEWRAESDKRQDATEARQTIAEHLAMGADERAILIERAVATLNREMGVVMGELKWIKILMGASTLGIFGQLVLDFFAK